MPSETWLSDEDRAALAAAALSSPEKVQAERARVIDQAKSQAEKDMPPQPILVTTLFGYKGDDCVRLECPMPILVRVVSLRFVAYAEWTDSVDAFYDVEILKDTGLFPGTTQLWMRGPSYGMNGNVYRP